ncbi:glucose-6-phosphate isomerase, partial [Amylibacter sp.]|nr:glucose-6-phosphate isomerase [Amylibacter sp.]
TLDFSKERIDEDILKNLIELAKSSDIEKARTAMFSGEHINNTENRAVMHVALRANAEDSYSIDGILTSTIVHDV